MVDMVKDAVGIHMKVELVCIHIHDEGLGWGRSVGVQESNRRLELD